MRSTAGVLCVVGMLASLAGCAKHAGPGGPGSKGTFEVEIRLSGTRGNCTATVDKDPVKLSPAVPNARWTVVDNCNDNEFEGETVLIFTYPPTIKRQWLDSNGVGFRARSKRGRPGEIRYTANPNLGQPVGSDVKYSVVHNGEVKLDPKVVWGR